MVGVPHQRMPCFAELGLSLWTSRGLPDKHRIRSFEDVRKIDLWRWRYQVWNV